MVVIDSALKVITFVSSSESLISLAERLITMPESVISFDQNQI
jgi:hypothetical protein